MDPFSQLRRSYDTEMLILRTLFALDPDTNLPISTNFIVTTDGLGGLVCDPGGSIVHGGFFVRHVAGCLCDLQAELGATL